MAVTEPGTTPLGPVLFAYDGSELAGFAIEQAGRQLAPGRAALVVCVWQPADVGFIPVREQHFNAQQAGEVEQAAQETAEHGAGLAERAGFRPRTKTVENAPTWKGIVSAAEDAQASLIVLGAHCHSGIRGHLLGSVASSVVSHAPASVLVIHPAS